MEGEEIDLANPEKPKSDGIQLFIDWNGAAQTKTVQHANQVVVQIVEHELNLSFFQFSPPVVLGSADDVQRQLRGVESVQPDCVARINMSTRTAKGLIQAIQKQFDEHGELRGDKDDAEE